MGCNGVYGLFGNGFMNPYLPMANFLTGTLGYKPCSIWSARNYTQFANVWTHNASYPYGFYFNFSGRPHYTVADAFQMPFNTALGLQTGQTYGAPSIAALQMQFEQMNEASGVRIDAQITAGKLGKAKSIGACKDQSFMKAEENKELREEVLAMEKKAEDLMKQLEDVMKQTSEGKLSAAEASAKIKVLSDVAKQLVGYDEEVDGKTEHHDGEADLLYNRIKDAEKAYNDKKVKEAEDKAKEEADKAEDTGKDGTVNEETGNAEETGTPEKKNEYEQPTPKTSAEKKDVTEKGTRVKVKNKAGKVLSGKYYEYNGKIYKIKNEEATPIDVTDQVDKIETPAS